MKQLEQDAHAALDTLRGNSRLLITLFILMLGTGIPELRKVEDLEFLKKQLYLGMPDAQAMAALDQLIRDSMDSTRTKLNNLIHNVRTGS